MRSILWFRKPAPDSGTDQVHNLPGVISGNRCRLTLTALLFACSALIANAQDYTSIVVFGDSLSDTGNVAHLTNQKYGVAIPGPAADYTLGRFTDGADTIPAARNYFGLWVEQLAAMMPSQPAVVDSLDGGTNYAYGFATTGNGTGLLTFPSSTSLSVNVDNVGLQITDYLATHPKINDKTLFIVWAGAIDVLHATSPGQVFDAAIQESLDVQRLIDAGATQFLVPNLPALGLIPELNGSTATSVPADEESVLYNDVLALGLNVLRDFNPRRHLTIYQLDVFTLLNRIVASPSEYALTNVTGMSQANFTADPDTWLFWDDLHPTTRGHNLLAVAADRLIMQPAEQATR